MTVSGHLWKLAYLCAAGGKKYLNINFMKNQKKKIKTNIFQKINNFLNILKSFRINLDMEPWFIRKQPYIWPLATHALAMSTVIWNPLLFFWLTRKPKRPRLARFSASIDALSSMFARMSTLRRISTLRSGQSTASDKFVLIRSSI